MVESLLWTGLAFLAGSVPFAVIIGHVVLDVDIRTVGDHNPGATNVLRAGGGVLWFIVALLLDFLKGMAPVGIAYFVVGLTDWQMVLVAIAPVAGHAFSPFLSFQGGKAVAVTFGIWGGLTLGEMPTLMGMFLVLMFLTVDSSGWAVMLMMVLALLHLLLNHNEGFLLAIWLGNTIIFAYKHRSELSTLPHITNTIPRLLRIAQWH